MGKPQQLRAEQSGTKLHAGVCMHTQRERGVAVAQRTFGKTPATQGRASSSCRRALRDDRPMASDNSWNRILMNMRALLVVASSVRTMLDSTPLHTPRIIRAITHIGSDEPMSYRTTKHFNGASLD